MKKENLEIQETVAGIFIKSPKGNWWLKPSNGRYDLLHKNMGFPKSGSAVDCYHRQNIKFARKEDAYNYILRHDEIRFSGHEYTDRVSKALHENFVYICVYDSKMQKTYAYKIKNGLKPARIIENLSNMRKDSKNTQVYAKSVLNNRNEIQFVSSEEELYRKLKDAI